MRDVTFDYPDWTAFCRLDGLGLVVIGQRVESDRAVLACRVAEPDGWCRRCGAEGAVRDSVIRRLAHEPFGWRPTTLEVTLRRYRRDRCDDCGHVWRQNMTAAAVAAGEDLPGRAPLGAGGDRVQAPDRGPDRYSPRSHPAEFRSAGKAAGGRPAGLPIGGHHRCVLMASCSARQVSWSVVFAPSGQEVRAV